MELTVATPIITLEDYIRSEEAGDIRHEFIDGKLIAMSGASRKHYKICKNLLLLFDKILADKGYEIFMENMKVKIEGENRYYYPDIFITKEPDTEASRYVQFHPELIVEVLSESTRLKDNTYQFQDYKKISSLQYYLLVEPEKVWVNYYCKNAQGEWQNEIFTRLNESVFLQELKISLPLAEMYRF